jgi:hypothetical protein
VLECASQWPKLPDSPTSLDYLASPCTTVASSAGARKTTIGSGIDRDDYQAIFLPLSYSFLMLSCPLDH